jgi:hypothetical protein
MRRSQILAMTFCSLACLGYPTRSANAGWFGPSNYDECMLDKMKGQPWTMGEIVAKACILQFACNDKFTADFGTCMRDPTLGFNYCAREAFQYCPNR